MGHDDKNLPGLITTVSEELQVTPEPNTVQLKGVGEGEGEGEEVGEGEGDGVGERVGDGLGEGVGDAGKQAKY